MRATVCNAPARRLLTGPAVLLAMILLLAIAFAVAVGGSGSPRGVSSAQRPAFTRRLMTIPAIVVTAPDTADVLAAAER